MKYTKEELDIFNKMLCLLERIQRDPNKCDLCNGFGEFGEDKGNLERPSYVITNCPKCKGTGIRRQNEEMKTIREETETLVFYKLQNG